MTFHSVPNLWETFRDLITARILPLKPIDLGLAATHLKTASVTLDCSLAHDLTPEEFREVYAMAALTALANDINTLGCVRFQRIIPQHSVGVYVKDEILIRGDVSLRMTVEPRTDETYEVCFSTVYWHEP